MSALLPSIVDVLCCPRDKAKSRSFERMELVGDVLRCGQGHEYPVVEGIPDLRPSPSEVGAENYGDIHAEFKIADSSNIDVEAWSQKFALQEHGIAGKDVLLAGAGVGTELACLLKFGPRRVVAIDYSANIRRLCKHYGGDERIVFIQADIMSLPFLDNTFDIVFNSGVVQHTRTPEMAFREMYHCARPGGLLSFGSVYMDTDSNRRITAIRLKHCFHRKPFPEVRERLQQVIRRRHWLSRFRLHSIDRLLTGLLIPNEGRDPEYALRQALDWYYPEYRHIFTENELQQWFIEVGCADFRKSGRQYIGKKNS